MIMAMRERSVREGRPPLLLVASLVVVDSLGYGLVVPVLPGYARDLGISDLGIGFLFASYAIAGLLGAVPLGWLSDRVGRKPFVLFGMFAMSAAFVFYALAEGYAMLVLARFLDGLTAAATWSAGLALLGDAYTGEVMGEKMGYAMGGAALGAIAGPLAGGLLYGLAGYKAPFLAVAALCALVGLAATRLQEDRGQAEVGGGMARTVLPMLRNRRLMLACTVTMVTTMGFGVIEPTLPVHLDSRFGLSPPAIGLLFGAFTAAYAAANPLAGRLSDRWGRKSPILAGLAASAVLAPALSIASSVPALYILMPGMGVAVAFFSTPALPLITEALPRRAGEPSDYGAAYGLFNIAWSAGYVLGPLMGGAVYGAAGLPHAYLLYGVLLCVLAVAVALRL